MWRRQSRLFIHPEPAIRSRLAAIPKPRQSAARRSARPERRASRRPCRGHVWLVGQGGIMVPGFADRPTRPGCAACAAEWPPSGGHRGAGIGMGGALRPAAAGQRGPMATIRSTGSVVVSLGHRDLAAPKPDARLDDVGRFVAVSARRRRVLAVAKPDQRLAARRRPRSSPRIHEAQAAPR
jgi:hypothetical protein